MLPPVGGGHQHVDVVPVDLLRRVTEQSRRRSAEGLDDALGIDDHHRIRDGLENRPEMGLARSRRGLCDPCIGDIGMQDDDTVQRAVRGTRAGAAKPLIPIGTLKRIFQQEAITSTIEHRLEAVQQTSGIRIAVVGLGLAHRSVVGADGRSCDGIPWRVDRPAVIGRDNDTVSIEQGDLARQGIENRPVILEVGRRFHHPALKGRPT